MSVAVNITRSRIVDDDGGRTTILSSGGGTTIVNNYTVDVYAQKSIEGSGTASDPFQLVGDKTPLPTFMYYGTLGQTDGLTYHKLMDALRVLVADAIEAPGISETIYNQITDRIVDTTKLSYVVTTTASNMVQQTSWDVNEDANKVGNFQCVVTIHDLITEESLVLKNIMGFDFVDTPSMENDNEILADQSSSPVILTLDVDSGGLMEAQLTGMSTNNKRIHFCFERCTQIQYVHKIPCDTGYFTVLMIGITPSSTYSTGTFDTGYFTVTGYTVADLGAMLGGIGLFKIKGYELGIWTGDGIFAEPGYYSLIGYDVQISDLGFVASTGYFAVIPVYVTLRLGDAYMKASVGLFTLTGYDITSVIDTCIEYGALYNWYAVDDSRNITSSDDWSVPSETQFQALKTYVGSDSTPLKEPGTTYWVFPNDYASNTLQFFGRGNGYRQTSGTFSSFKTVGYIWTSTEHPTFTYLVYSFDIRSSSTQINITTYGKGIGMAIRLIKDATGISDGVMTTYTGNDGKEYNAVCINQLYWLMENLSESQYRDSSPIPIVTDNAQWAALGVGAMCAYNNVESNISCDFAPVNDGYVLIAEQGSFTLTGYWANLIIDVCIQYGALYTWAITTGTGDNSITSSDDWVVPSLTNLQTLADAVGAGGNYSTNTVGTYLKESGTAHWNSGNTGTNIYGFNGRGSGQRDWVGSFGSLKSWVRYWTTTDSGNNAYIGMLEYNYTRFRLSTVYSKDSGCSIRLVKNTTTLSEGQMGTYTGNDGKIYNTICIGTQEWLANDLCETKYRNASDVTYVYNSTDWTNLGYTSKAMCAFNNTFTNVSCDFPHNYYMSAVKGSFTVVGIASYLFIPVFSINTTFSGTTNNEWYGYTVTYTQRMKIDWGDGSEWGDFAFGYSNHTYADATEKTVVVYMEIGSDGVRDFVFRNNTALTSNPVFSHSAFDTCETYSMSNTNMTSITFPTSPTATLKTLYLYSSDLTSLDYSMYSAFEDLQINLSLCTSLSSITMPSSFTGGYAEFYLRSNAFTGTLDLSKLTAWSIDQYAGNDQGLLLRDLNVTGITLPASITGTICNISVNNLDNLTSLDLSCFTSFDEAPYGGGPWVFIIESGSLSSLTWAGSITNLTPFVFMYMYNNNLDYVDLTGIDFDFDGANIRLDGNSMTAAEVNHILVDLDNNTTALSSTRTIQIGGSNAAPDSSSGGYNGTAAKASLEGKGWTVTTS